MINHFITLQVLADELNKILKDGIIQDAFTQQKGELLINIKKDLQYNTLSVSINPQLNFMFVREQIPRAKKNSVTVFKEIKNDEIKRISSHLFERIIKIDLKSGLQLLFHLFGTASSNVFLIDQNKIIINTFKNTKEYVNKEYSKAYKEIEVDYDHLIADFNTFKEIFLKDKDKTTYNALKSTFTFLGSTITREVLHRAGVEDKVHIDKISIEDCKGIFQELINIFAEMSKPTPTIYYSGEIPRVFSVLKLQHLSGSRVENYDSVNEAIKTFIIKSFKICDIDKEKKDLIIRIKNELDKLIRTKKTIEVEVLDSKQAEEYEKIAKIIMANLQHLTKGTREIDIEDIFDDNKMIHITLDPKMTPVQNAENYFNKARKARAVAANAIERLEKINKDISLLEKILLHLDGCQTREQLVEFKDENEIDLIRLGIISRGEKEESLPFKIFKVAGGYEVWVGKSAEKNDLLTMKYAKPNDLWFHARGVSGSHVVLRVTNNKVKPPKEAILQAASIAAYYSKMRNATNVPVSYCERKYLRKPKNSKPGSIILDREKVVFVDPVIPST